MSPLKFVRVMGYVVLNLLADRALAPAAKIADSSIAGIEGAVYPGTCREGLAGCAPRAWRADRQ